MRAALSLTIAAAVLVAGTAPRAAPAPAPADDQPPVAACAAVAGLWQDDRWRPDVPSPSGRDRQWLSDMSRDLGWLAVLARGPVSRPDLALYAKATLLYAGDHAAYLKAQAVCRAADARRRLPHLPVPAKGDSVACLRDVAAMPDLAGVANTNRAELCRRLRAHSDALLASMGRLERGELSCLWPEDAYIHKAKWRLTNLETADAAGCPASNASS